MLSEPASDVKVQYVAAAYCQHTYDLVLADGEIVRMTCRNPRCSLECRANWADWMNSVLQQSARDLPPTHTAGLAATGLTSQQLRAAHAKLYRKLRRAGHHYCSFQEWKDARQHLHLILRCPFNLHVRTLKTWWVACLPKGATATNVYCAKITHPKALARYVTKHPDSGREGECPPEFYRGRIVSYSSKFFSASTEELWKRELRERFGGKAPHQGDSANFTNFARIQGCGVLAGRLTPSNPSSPSTGGELGQVSTISLMGNPGSSLAPDISFPFGANVEAPGSTPQDRKANDR